jgi:hypothetical protein
MTGKTKQRKKSKFYAVSVGRTVGIFDTWNEASKSVTGFPGSSHQSFKKLCKAEEAMRKAGIVESRIFRSEDHDHDDVDFDPVPDETRTNEQDTAIDTIPDDHEDDEEVEEECNDDENSEGEDEEEHQTHVKVLAAETTCVCKGAIISKNVLKCSDCGSKIHWICSQLPIYQVGIFHRSQRKFTCERCAEIIVDERAMEVIEQEFSKFSQTTDSSVSTSTVTEPNFIQALKAHDQSVRAMVGNMEQAMNLMAEQLADNNNAILKRLDQLHQSVILKSPSSQHVSPAATVRAWGAQEGVPRVSPPVLISLTENEDSATSTHLKQENMKKNKKERKKTQNNFEHKIDMPTSGVPVDTPTTSQDHKEMTSREVTATSSEKAKHRVDQNNKKTGYDSLVERSQKKNSEKRNQHAVEASQSNDEDSSESTVSDVASSVDKDEIEDHEDQDADVPSVVFLTDSIMKDVDVARLGRSYGLQIEKRKTSTIGDISRCVGDECPDVYILHTGINDIKTAQPENTSEALIQTVKELLEVKNSNVVISQITPTNINEIKGKVAVHNALVYASLCSEKRVSFVSHEHLQAFHLQPDDLHLNPKGASLAAATIGRHLASLFWSQSRSRGSRRSKQPRQWRQGYQPTVIWRQHQQHRRRVFQHQQQYWQNGSRYEQRRYLQSGYEQKRNHQHEHEYRRYQGRGYEQQSYQHPDHEDQRYQQYWYKQQQRNRSHYDRPQGYRSQQYGYQQQGDQQSQQFPSSRSRFGSYGRRY